MAPINTGMTRHEPPMEDMRKMPVWPVPNAMPTIVQVIPPSRALIARGNSVCSGLSFQCLLRMRVYGCAAFVERKFQTDFHSGSVVSCLGLVLFPRPSALMEAPHMAIRVPIIRNTIPAHETGAPRGSPYG